MPKQVRIVSPDWSGEKKGQAQMADGRLTITLPDATLIEGFVDSPTRA